jgi:SAM-dependent methyltransferase
VTDHHGETERLYETCATFYDADYASAGYDHDVPFYVELAKEAFRETGAPVLELGCGTGRVLLPIAREGVEIVGVDASAGMLARLEEHPADEPAEVRRRVRTLRGDVRTVDARGLAGSAGGFGLVTAPFRVVHHLVTADDQRAFLRNAARHLTSNGAPAGTLVFDLFQPDYSMVADEPSTSVDIERTEPETGRTVRRVSSSHHHPELQTFDVAFEWLIEGPGGEEETVEAGSSTLRWFTRAELELLLELEGFEVMDVWGDFERTVYGEGAEAIVIRARPAR